MSESTTWMPCLCMIIVISGVFLALYHLGHICMTHLLREIWFQHALVANLTYSFASSISSSQPYAFFLITRRMLVKLSAHMRACRIYHDIITRTMLRLSFFSSGSGIPGCSACARPRSDLLSAPALPSKCACLHVVLLLLLVTVHRDVT